MAQLLVDVLAENRRKKRFLLHEFVIMPNHFHLLLTPRNGSPAGKGTAVDQRRFLVSREAGNTFCF
jgi:REP element-mobilizing transposase RayT